MQSNGVADTVKWFEAEIYFYWYMVNLNTNCCFAQCSLKKNY